MAYGDTVLDEIMAQLRGVAPAGEAPAVPAAPAVAPPGPSATRFYNRPITLPEGLKTAARRGLGAFGRFAGPVGTAVGLTELMKTGLEANAERFAKPSVQATVERGRAGFGALAPQPQAPAVSAAPAPLTDTQREAALEVGRIQAAIEANRAIASPEAGGTGISVGGLRYAKPGLPDVGGFTSAILGIKQKTGEVQTEAARARASAATLAAQGTAARGTAAERTSQLGAAMAAEYLKRNPGDLAGAAAVLHGRSQSGQFTFFPGLTPESPVIVGHRGTGAVVKRTPSEVAKVSRGSDGKFYIVDAAGKPVREATKTELEQIRQ